MRVLFTGTTPKDCGTTKRASLIPRYADAIVSVLEGMGAAVDNRVVTVGEDLSSYDLCVVINKAPLSMTSPNAPGVGWTMSQDRPLLLYFDDWQLSTGVNHSRSMAKREDYLYRRVGEKRRCGNAGETDEHLQAYAQWIMYGFARFCGMAEADGRWPAHWRGLLPCFSWGDRSVFEKILPARPGQLAYCDFSAIGTRHLTWPSEVVWPEDRERRWLVPSLMPHKDWVDKLELTWPVDYLGSKKLKAERVPEQEVVERMQLYAGTLSPSYKRMDGGGWWRTRYNIAAATMTPIAGNPKEAGPAGGAFRLTPRQVEQLAGRGRALDDLALEQRHQLLQRQWPEDWAVDYLRQVIERTMRA